MSAVENTAGVYDAKHPWISGPHEDPSKANWLNEFFSPFGLTPKPIFLRGQAYLALLRFFIFIAGLIALGANPWVGSGILFFGFVIVLTMSVVSHTRRLNDSARSPVYAIILIVPILLAAGLTVPGLSKIPDQIAASEEAVKKAKEQTLSSKATAETAATDESAESKDADAKADGTTKPKAAQGRGRHGPPKVKTTESLIGGAVAGAAWSCMILSIFTALFTFLFVARGKTVKQDYNPLVR